MDAKTLIAAARPIFAYPLNGADYASITGGANATPTSAVLGGSIVESLPFSLHTATGTSLSIADSSIWISSKANLQFSVEFYIKATSVSTTETKVLERGSDYIYYRDGEIGAVVNGQRVSILGIDPTLSNYVALSYGEKIVTLYAGGRRESVTLTATITNTNTNFVVNGSATAFNISMISGYARLLKAEEITAHDSLARNSLSVGTSDQSTDIHSLDYDVFEYDLDSVPAGFDLSDYISINAQELASTLEVFSIPLGSYDSVSGIRIDIGLFPKADATVEYDLGTGWVALPEDGILTEFPPNAMTSTTDHLLVRVSFPALSVARLYYARATVFKSLVVDDNSSEISIAPSSNAYQKVAGREGQITISVTDQMSVSAIGIWLNHDGTDSSIISAPVTVSVAAGSVTATGTDDLLVSVSGQTAIPVEGQSYIYVELTTPVTNGDIVIGSTSSVINRVMFYETDPGKAIAEVEYRNSIGGAGVMSLLDTIGTISDSESKIYTYPWAILSAGG